MSSGTTSTTTSSLESFDSQEPFDGTSPIGETIFEQTYFVDGQQQTITAKLFSKASDSDRPYCWTVHAVLSVRTGDNAPAMLGSVHGRIVDKTSGNWRGGPGWHELLGPYGDREGYGDLVRALRRLFRQQGQVLHNVRQHEASLSHDQLHYISKFSIVPRFRGKGLAELGMQAYLSALQSAEFGFAGTVILWPAGILRDTTYIEKQTGKTCDWHETVQKLVKFYGKSGFEVWIPGNPKLDGSMTIMGLVLTPGK